MQTQDIESLINNALNCELVRVESEDGHHYFATVVCSEFQEKNLLERQRMVYRSLDPHMTNGDIHALSLKTYSKEEWQNQ